MRSCESRLVRSSGNILLRRLMPADQILLESLVEPVFVQRGEMMIGPSDMLNAFYFPETAIFSLEEAVGTSGHVEVAVVGREGMLGWPALLGAERTTHAAVAQLRAGSALRIPIVPLRRAFATSANLWSAFLQFVHVVIVQMARSIASHLHDALDLRLARWLLMRHDRLGGDLLLVRHEEIAGNLNVRRASITDHLHLLEGDRLIRCNRGKILIRDRAALETFAGEAYGSAEAHYRTLIAPFGKTAACEQPS